MIIPISPGLREGMRTVVNLSKTFQLSDQQLSLLNKGLTFIPTKGYSKSLWLQCKFDIQQYHRRVKLAVHFGDKNNSEPQPFTLKSYWSPPLGQLPPQVGDLIKQDLEFFDTNFQPKHVKPNLTPEEFEALKELSENKQIIIKPADKGSAIVILDREQYLQEGYRQLNDKKYYSKLTKPIYLNTVPMIEKIIDNLLIKKFINLKQKRYLLGASEPRPRLFYMLPKIHKEAEKWSIPFQIPPGRPIVSDCDSETYYTAEYLDHFLNPLSTRHASYIKDTYDFVHKVRNLYIPEESFLFSIDIDSLYTNIDIKEGINAVRNIFFKYPDKKRPDKELLQLLEINLTRNDFQFNGEFFLQIKGTAMGKKFAPAYANIFMAEWETTALEKCEKQPLHYFRFLDDIWGIWPHSKEDFELFLRTLNNHNASIKLKSTISNTSIDFLDTTTFKGPNFLITNQLDVKVFFKPTDSHALLFKSSFHPKHTFAGLIKSQLLRFHRICSQQADFKEATRILFSALSTRGYCRSFLRKCFKSFLEVKPRNVAPLLPFVTTFSPSTTKLIRVIKTNFQKFSEENQMLRDYKIIGAFRRNKNLRDFLVKAKVPPLIEPRQRGQRQFFQHRKWVHSFSNNNVFLSQYKGNAGSKNCVYLITCKTCGRQYVGETGNTLLIRFTQHRYNILRRRKVQTHLVKHFLEHGWEAVSATVIQANPRWTAGQRKRAERVWIAKLDTRHPKGLNEKSY